MEISGPNPQSKSFILLINVKMPTIMSRINFKLSELSIKKVLQPRDLAFAGLLSPTESKQTSDT